MRQGLTGNYCWLILGIGVLLSFEEIQGVIGVFLEDVTVCDLEGTVIIDSKQFKYSCDSKDFEFEITN